MLAEELANELMKTPKLPVMIWQMEKWDNCSELVEIDSIEKDEDQFIEREVLILRGESND